MITYEEGKTRFVFLIGQKAFKVGRIRFFKITSKILSLIISKSKRLTFSEEYGPGFTMAVWHYFMIGVFGNRNEYHYYQSTLDKRVMPTRTILLFGLIIIQNRGCQVPDSLFESFKKKSAWIPESIKIDLQNSRQYRLDSSGEIKIVDYGNRATIEFLLKKQ